MIRVVADRVVVVCAILQQTSLDRFCICVDNIRTYEAELLLQVEVDAAHDSEWAVG